jgi:Family of unknown function (DUF5397)
MIQSLLTTVPEVPVGKIKTFGMAGPSYKVLGQGHSSSKGEWLVPIRVIESGEELEYLYSRFLQDPEAR